MSRRPPIYYSCQRCGYRGVDAQHVCDERGLIAQPAAARASTDDRPAPAPPRPPDVVGLDDLATTFSRITGRVLRLEGDGTGVRIAQRCTVCRGDIAGRVPLAEDAPASAALQAIDAAIRRAYLLHRCPAVDASLIGLSAPDLDELYESLERDAVRLAERLLALDALRKQR